MLRYTAVDVESLAALFPQSLARFLQPNGLSERLKIEATYEAHVRQQQLEIEEVRRDEGLRLPDDLDYQQVGASLSTEAREMLENTRPQTIGAASRVPGVTPAAIVNLLRFVKFNHRLKVDGCGQSSGQS
ncbi:5-taurinomethyluridine-[tRNA] synthase subunit MTO1, mitochondrial-like [Cetorhinus maximus]